jgi:hypothetical protein
MFMHRTGGPLVAVLASVTLLVACASGTSIQVSTATASPTVAPSSAAPPTPTPSPSPAPEATPTPSPRAWGAYVYVTGTQRCAGSVGKVTTDASGEIHQRNGTIWCVNEFNDSRVSGEINGTFTFDGSGSLPSLAFVEWGVVRLNNDGGAWLGHYSGVATPDTGDLVTFWFEGTGEYAGLSFFEWSVMPGSLGLVGFPVVGHIFPGSPPEPEP